MLFTDLIQFSDTGLFILRLVIGILFLYHAMPKLKDAKGMAAMMGMEGKGPMVLMLGLVESVSAIGIILGIFTQLLALVLSVIMLGAIVTKITKWHVPFTAMDKTGWEFDLILLAATVAILLTGGGSITLPQ